MSFENFFKDLDKALEHQQNPPAAKIEDEEAEAFRAAFTHFYLNTLVPLFEQFKEELSPRFELIYNTNLVLAEFSKDIFTELIISPNKALTEQGLKKTLLIITGKAIEQTINISEVIYDPKAWRGNTSYLTLFEGSYAILNKYALKFILEKMLRKFTPHHPEPVPRDYLIVPLH